jgi:integrase
MRNKFRLYPRGNGVYYIQNNETKAQESLWTRDRLTAERLFNARNEAHLQPQINREIAQAYLSACDSESKTRTWQHVMDALVATKDGPNRERYERAMKAKPFDKIRDLIVIETQPEHFLNCLKADDATVSTNSFLRRVHNFGLDMQWLLRALLTRKTWPKLKHAKKRGITPEEYKKIVERERNPERKLFYQFLWHLGGSQTDVACLRAENIDRENRVICYERAKLDGMEGQHPALICYGKEVARILDKLPKEGFLFPYLASVDCKDRATEFRQRCQGLGITGVTLHSFRYAWAERAKQVGMPERYAAEALGHNSKAVHRAYAKGAQVKVPALEDYEKPHAEGKLLRFTSPVLGIGEPTTAAQVSDNAAIAR